MSSSSPPVVVVVRLEAGKEPEAVRVSSEGAYVAALLGEGSQPTFYGSADNGGETGVFLMGDARVTSGPPVPPCQIPPGVRTDGAPLRGTLVMTKLRYFDDSTMPVAVDFTLDEYLGMAARGR